ncbi:MAG: glycogen synthase GlgA [Candidatus Omnitrophota bacterium]
MKIAYCSSEVVPFAKTGGLADVAGSLPQALEALGHEVAVFMPKYKTVKISGKNTTVGKNVKVYFIENEKYFGRDNLYGDKTGDYPDNLDRFSFFCRETIEFMKKIKFKPDIINCNDWQTALICIYVKKDPYFKNTKTVFTIHNLSYQGLFSKEELHKTGLGWEYFNMEALEYYGKINLLKGGIVFSDVISTVSPTYAKEIQTQQFGCGLEGILTKRSGRLFGIVNGIDYEIWDPEKDKKIFKNYSVKQLKDKYINKTSLQEELAITSDENIPMLGMISRLVDQKGFDILSGILDKLLPLKVQFVLLATGEPRYHVLFEEKAKKFHNLACILRFDATLAQKIYAGSDIFLMPSLFEPCGLGQMISLKYGTIPLVRKTGGLADTITDYNPLDDTGNGFVFEEYNSAKLFDTIRRALASYENKIAWRKLVMRAMKCDFSWNASAKEYIKLYQKTVKL